MTIFQSWKGAIDLWDAKPQGLGGWDLDVHHNLDLPGHIVRFGDGSNLTPSYIPAVIQTVVGNGTAAREVDGGPATSSAVPGPQSVAIGPDGSIYVVELQDCVRRVTPDGVIHTFAGTCETDGFSGDGGPATAALLHSPEDIAFGPDGSLYIADSENNCIRRVYPNGIIQTVAGSGPGATAGGFAGDGGPRRPGAVPSAMGRRVAGAGWNDLHCRLDNERIRRVSPAGIVTTVAGNGSRPFSRGTGGPRRRLR